MCATPTVHRRISLVARDLGEAIRLIRKLRLGLNQQEFAEKLGVSRHSTVSDWERGKAVPPPERLEQIADLAGETVEDLFGDVRPNRVAESPALYGADLAEAEEWLSRIANPDMLRRQAGTPTGRDLIKGIKSFLFDLPWPVEQKNAVDALLNRIAADAATGES
jgi:transcriptional regulator with XRE-family HTH domain